MQTRWSASLVALLVGASVTAHAEPDEPSNVQRPGEDLDGEQGHTEEKPPPPTPPPKRPPTGQFMVGAGFSSDEHFIAMARISQDDLFHTGQRLSLGALISARRQLFDLRYEIPHIDGSAFSLSTELFNHEQQLPGFRRSEAGGGIGISQLVGDHTQAFLGYRVAMVGTTLDDPVAEHGDLPPEVSTRGGRLASLRTGLAYATLDQPFLPTSGTSFGFAVAWADKRTGSEINLTRLDGWANTHRAVGPFIVHAGATISSVDSRDPEGVPLSERLQLDTGSIVRGYVPGSIGPHDPTTGLSLGGELEYTARGELELPLFKRVGISAVGFVDHAGIYDRSGAGSSGTSYGFGLVWRSPIGPLRFDWAFPLGEDKPHFVFGIGSPF